MAKSAPLDTTIEVVTPENIGFRYHLAGPFRRLPAYALDVAIRLGIFLLLALVISLIAGGFGFATGFSLLPALGLSIVIVAYFGLSWFYGVFFETYYNGRTPGKWATGLRVISDDGHPVSGKQALLRNLIRVADLGPAATLPGLDSENTFLAFIPLSTGVVGLTAMLFSKRLQRLGDLAAGTLVVVDERNWTLPVAKVDDARVPALATYIPADYQVSPSMAQALAAYAERRLFLSPGRRREIAKHLAIPLIDRFEFRRDIDPDLLLYALYYRTFLADDQKQPSDLGPLAGFSPLQRDVDRQIAAGNGQELTSRPESAAATLQPAAAVKTIPPGTEMDSNQAAVAVQEPPDNRTQPSPQVPQVDSGLDRGEAFETPEDRDPHSSGGNS